MGTLEPQPARNVLQINNEANNNFKKYDMIFLDEWQNTELTLIYHYGFNPKTINVICEHIMMHDQKDL